MQQRYSFGKKTAIVLNHNLDRYGNVYCKIFDNGKSYNMNIPRNQLTPIISNPVKSITLRGRTISGPSCADCGTGENMGFMQGVKCPNCESVEINLPKAQFLANKLSNALYCDKGGSCVHFAERFCKLLIKNNIHNFVVVEGWVKSEKEKFWRQHTWIEIEGQKIDPTFIQFNYLNNVNYVSRVKKRHTPEEYMSLCLKYPEDIKNYVKKGSFKEWLISTSKK